MKRREFLRGAAAGMLGGAALTLGACGASAPEPTTGEQATDAPASPAAGAAAPAQGAELPQVEWRMTTSWPISLDTIYGGAVTVAERVSAMTGGRFRIQTFPAGEIVPAFEVADAVQQGTVEAGHTASYYFTGKGNIFQIATTMPFGLTAQQQNAWLYHGGGLEALQAKFADFNIIQFPAGNTGAQMGGWYKREVNTLQDLQGLKFRIPGFGGKVMERLGALPQAIPGGEIFLALDRGAIDAAEWVGPYDDEKLGLNDAADFYYYPGWWEPGPTLDAYVNLDQWNSLPAEYQEIFKSACYESNINMLAKYDALNREALQRLVEGGTQLKPYSDEILAAAQQASFEIYDELSAEDANFKEIFDQWIQFRTAIYQWNRTNEWSLSTFVYNNPVE